MPEPCPLCSTDSRPFSDGRFSICENCGGIFRPQALLPGPEEESARYRLHQNDIRDTGYRNFLSPVIDAVLAHQNPKQRGLDFGCGPEPSVSLLLREKGYSINYYDPFFHPEPIPQNRKFDFIVCSEVIEHFHRPDREFTRLKELLTPRGRLYCMTWPFDDSIDFDSWSYKNDFTHTFFYRERTLRWIRDYWRFNSLHIDKRLIVFVK